MSEALDALLGASLKDEKDVFIKRLNTNFKVQSISGDDLNELTDEASRYEGKGAKRKKETDEYKLGALIIAKACVDPKFNDKELLKKYGAVSADEVVMKALRAGEIAKLSQEITSISGFDFDEEDIDDVKN